MPRIDPLSLLKCLSVLLGPTGGIKSKEEVHRLANLMTKFSKKLVSKCIYIQILKTTNTDLLSQFMTAGGWNLIHTWLTDGILAKNWALIQELLELLLLCPVDIERLKSNNCPKLIKGLSKEGSHQGVRTLASRLVEQWLKIVKGEAAPNSVPAQIMTVPVQSNTIAGQTVIIPSSQQLQLHSTNSQQIVDATENATVHVQDFKFAQQSTASISINQQDQEKQQQLQERLQPQTVQVVGKAQQVQVQQQVTQQQCKKQSFVVVSTSSSLPVYKITIRDGNQVLAKVETDAANISNVLNTASTSTASGHDPNATQEAKPETEELDETEENGVASGRDDVDVVQSDDSGHVPSEVKQIVVSSKDNQDIEGVKSKDSKDIASSDSGKSSDKENRDSHKKDDKKSSSSSEKKSSGHHHGSSSSSLSSSKSSKHSTSSSAHRSSTSHRSSSHRSGSSSSSSSKNSSSSKDKSSKDKDKHHSSSSSKHSSSKSKSDRDKEKEKEKQKKDQAEKDKATLEKVQGQALSSKMGKIPKKRTEDEKSSDANGRKSSIESRDSSKENKEKADSKKDTVTTKPVTEKKNISISIENRKNSQDSGTRPKTVKTFNSKFRSTGLEEEVKPPPPRSKKGAPAADKKVLPPKLPLKRPSPLRDVPLVEKRMKLSLDSPTTPPSDEKKGGIKLIPPKPKPMMLQESDMFMDALTASTKSKEPRKRKRRASITKDGSEAKKQEVANADNRESTPPPASPSNVEEKSPIALKPNFKFYQDTLEIEEDKDQREKESGEEESKKDKDQVLDEEKDSRDDDDSGSNTPTPEEDVEEIKDVESPEDTSSVISDSTKKDSSYPEIRYVDGLKSVLLLQKRKGPKKVLKWKTDLESIRYFELDETERVNVTKTFTDMKQMEKQNEREAFQMARKLNNEDLMEERTRWKPLIPIDLPPPLVEPGKDSKEKDIQYAREKGILQALYFNRSMIPDSAAEPDEERHHVMTDPKIIPLEDLTGNKESEKDFTAIPWPEPKPQPPQLSTVTTFHYPTTYTHNQQSMMTAMGPQSTMGPMSQMPQQMMAPTHMAPMSQEMAGPLPTTGAGGWRTGDGKVLVPDVGLPSPMVNMSGFNQSMEGGPMISPGMIGPPPMYNQEGYGMMCPDDMGYNNFQGPPGPMYGPGPNFPGPRGAHMHNRGRGGPGWGYRGPVRGGWRGVGGGWRGSGKQPPVCRQFSKNGYCRVGDKCQYLHPGVNCPPF